MEDVINQIRGNKEVQAFNFAKTLWTRETSSTWLRLHNYSNSNDCNEMEYSYKYNQTNIERYRKVKVNYVGRGVYVTFGIL